MHCRARDERPWRRSAGHGQHVAGHQAIRRQQHEAACHGLGHADFRAAKEDHVPQPAEQEHVGDRQQGDEDFGRSGTRVIGDRSREAVLPSVDADARQQHPIAQDDPEHQLIAGEGAQQLPHEHQLRQEGRQAEAADGKREDGRGKVEGESGKGEKKRRKRVISPCSRFPVFPFTGSFKQDRSTSGCVPPPPAFLIRLSLSSLNAST